MIKKTGLIYLLSAWLCSQSQASDFGFEVGAALWSSNITGGIDYQIPPSTFLSVDLESNLSMNKTNNSRYYFVFYHPIKLVPNILISANRIKHRGVGSPNINDITNIQSNNFDETVTLKGSVDISHYDVTAFWTPLDITPFSLDLGFTYRKFHGDLNFNIESSFGSLPITSSIDNQYLLAFTRGTFELPLTGLSASLLLNFGNNFNSKNNEQAIDTDVSLNYRHFTGMGIAFGYRYFDVDLNSAFEGNEVTYKLDTFGPYLSLSFRL